MARGQVVNLTFNVQNVDDLREANRLLGQMSKPSGPVGGATKGVNRFGNASQNAAFQVQDLIVQLEGGVSASRAIGQQLPQLLGGFGALGASLGVVAALMPVIIRQFTKGEDETEKWSKAVETLNAEFDRLGKEAPFALQRVEFAITAAVNSATKQARELRSTGFIDDIARFFQIIGRAQAGILNIGTFSQVEQQQVIDNLKDQFGITEETAKQIAALSKLYEEGTITGEQYSNAVNTVAESAERGNIEFFKFAESLRVLGQEVPVLEELATGAEKLSLTLDQLIASLEQSGAISGGISAGESVRRLLDDIDPSTPGQVGDDFLDNLPTGENTAILTSGLEEFEATAEEAFDLAAAGAEAFSQSFDSAVDGVARGTQSIDDAFKSMAQSVLLQLGKIAAEFVATQIVASFFSPAPAADGAVMSGGRMTAFAKGGVVNSPTLFPMANGAGLMGEAGPEAIMPLQRDSSGRLGVSAEGMNITINNNVPGAEVRTSQNENGLTVDLVLRQVASAVRRGGNELSDSLEKTYPLSRGQGAY